MQHHIAMSSLQKLVEKFVYKPETVITTGEVRRLLEAFGYGEKKKRRSECLFHKKGATVINVPTVKGRGVKSIYVKRLTKILNLEEWIEEHKGD